MDVEMTAYMVLSLLHISGKGYLEEAARAVRWITTQRNSHGGFVSTQVRDSSGSGQVAWTLPLCLGLRRSLC